MTTRFDPARPAQGYIYGLKASDDAPSRYFVLIIHPTVEHMRAAARRHDAKRGGSTVDGFYDDILGTFQGTHTRARYDRKTRLWVDTTPRFAGVMRLVNGNLTRSIVAHESIHAALHITRMETWRVTKNGGGEADFGHSCDEREESFAYLAGDIVSTLEQTIDEWHEGTGLVRALS